MSDFPNKQPYFAKKAQKTQPATRDFFPQLNKKRSPKSGIIRGLGNCAPDTRESCSFPCHGPGADITTKAQMTPHFSFVHRNESWNNSFILHYWQRTILTQTLVVCSNASISCHCLSSEMKTAI